MPWRREQTQKKFLHSFRTQFVENARVKSIDLCLHCLAGFILTVIFNPWCSTYLVFVMQWLPDIPAVLMFGHGLLTDSWLEKDNPILRAYTFTHNFNFLRWLSISCLWFVILFSTLNAFILYIALMVNVLSHILIDEFTHEVRV